MNAQQRAAMEQALEDIKQFVLKELTVGQRYTNEGQGLLDSIDALTAALEQPAQKCNYPYCGCDSKAWCKVERNAALDKMAENAREIGLDYEPAQQECQHCGGTGDVSGEYPGVACPECNGVGTKAQPEFIKHEVENAYDWSEWVCPNPESYLMKCCDCGLVHEAQFGVVRYASETEREDCERVDDPNLEAVFRMRRSEEWSPKDMAHRAGGLPMEQPEQQEPVTEVLSSRKGNDTSTIDRALPNGTRLYTRPQARKPNQRPWCPDVCPITGLPFFMWIEHHETGQEVPTYGGPYDSYTIPVREKDGSYCRERYDHDRGGWLTDEVEDVGVQIVSDQAFVYDDERPQAREWVGLTESEIIMCSSLSVFRFYDAIEAKLREKNS